jgi:hypothetical protein
MGGIYLVREDGTLLEMTRTSYVSEDGLQRLLASYPSLLAGDQIDSGAPRRWLLVSREQEIPAEEGGAARWAVDHLFIDQDAVPTLVEVKRSTDTRVRREVVGQMLDYAANAIAYWPVEDIRSRFEARCEGRSEDPDVVLMQFLEQDEDPNVFWGKVKTNLQAGKVRLVFVADEIPSELRRIVEFLNGQMDPAEVLALEVPQYVGGSLKSLVPRVIGQTAEAQQKKSVGQRVTRQWDEASFFEELLKARGEEETQVARAILEWTRASIPRATWWGRGQSLGAYVPVLDHKGIEARLVSLFTNGTLQIAFRYMQHRPPFDNRRKREELLERLNGIPGVSLPSESIENRSPSIPYSALKETSTLKHFLEVLEWAVEQVRAV